MKKQKAFLGLSLFCLLAATAIASIDWDVYVSGERPQRNQPPGTNPPWTKVKDASNPTGTFTITLAKGERIYIGIPNEENNQQNKSLTIVISGNGCENLKAKEAEGRSGSDGKGKTSGSFQGPTNDQKNKYPGCNIINVFFPEQPGWEWICLQNTGNAGNFTFTIELAASNCNKKGTKPDYPCCYREDGSYGGSLEMVGVMGITEIWNFPRTATVNTAVLPVFTADPSTGNWTASFVYADPLGNPKLQGGVRFTSDGAGLQGGDEYGYEFTMIECGEKEYDIYIFDAVDGEYYPWEGLAYPVVRQWRSVRDHAGLGPLPVVLDPICDSNGPYGPAAETRLGGIQRIEVEFDRSVTLLDPVSLVVTDGIDYFIPDSFALEDGDTVLALEFITGLPPQHGYTIRLNNAIEDLLGDRDCQIRSLLGDVNADGIVGSGDTDEIVPYIGMPAEEETAQYDIDLDGMITVLDNDIIVANYDQTVFCDEWEEYLPGDLSGPEGFPDYYVNLLDLAELAASWVLCNDPWNPVCEAGMIP